MRQGATPVPIPNTMVKTLPADDTRLETARESRRLPEFLKKFISDSYAEDGSVRYAGGKPVLILYMND